MSDTIRTSSTPDNADECAVLSFRRREYRVRAGLTVREAMIHCGLQPEEVLVTRNGELIEDNVVLQAGDRVKLLLTISGG